MINMKNTIPVHHARYMKERADAVKAPVHIHHREGSLLQIRAAAHLH